MRFNEQLFEEVTINLDKKRIPLSSAERAKRQGTYRYYGAQGVIDMIDGFIFEGEYLLIAEDGENLKSKKQNIAQIVMGQFWVNNHAHIIQTNSLCNIRYLYYTINSMDISGYITGSAQPKLSQANMNKINLKIPPIGIQNKVVSILSALDDKIELNNKINENLEQQAQAIFKEMFITNTKSEWQVGQLSELISIKYGKDHKKLADGIYPLYGSGGIMRYVERPLYEKESVLIPRKGTLSNVIYVNEPFWSVDTMFYTEMKKLNIAKFIFHFINSLDLNSMNAGSAVPSMTTNILNSLELKIPDDTTLLKFETVVSPMYLQMQTNGIENQKLAELRDTLLPKLMSGELNVSEVQL